MRISDWSSDVCSSDLDELQVIGDKPDRGIEEEQPQHAGDGRGHRIGPDEQRLVARRALDHAIRHDRQQQCQTERQGGDRAAEVGRGPEGLQVKRIGEQEHERSEEHTSELQSLMRISYAVFCLKQKKYNPQNKSKRTNT